MTNMALFFILLPVRERKGLTDNTGVYDEKTTMDTGAKNQNNC